jgi:serine/threonine-protein phosphatase 6 regulatory ankyrin repeat subunit B
LFNKPNPRRDEVNGYDGNGYTALSLAVKAKRYDLVVILVESKVSLDIYDEKTGMTPLMYSVHNHTHEISNLLIREGADINLCDYHSVSPLMIACCLDDSVMAMTLCGSMANVDEADYNGWTPLHYAAFGCSAECCKILITYGADRSIADTKNRLPIDIAKYRDTGKGMCIAALEDKKAHLSLA